MSIAVELWRALEAWDPDRHPRGPGGRFIKGLGGGGRKSLADAVSGTAGGGPKRQRKDGMSVADAVRKAARTSDTTGRPTRRPDADHRAHGAHDVADEVERALADAGVSDDVRQAVSARARARADSHGPRPGARKSSKPAASEKRTLDEAVADIRAAVIKRQSARDDSSTLAGDFVAVHDLRSDLKAMGYSEDEQDAGFAELLNDETFSVMPWAHGPTRKNAERLGKPITVGGEDRHIVNILNAPGGQPIGSRSEEIRHKQDAQIAAEDAAYERARAQRADPVGDGLDRYRTTEDQYRQHYDGYTDEELTRAARSEGMSTEGSSRAGIVSALAAERARQDRKTLERNLLERQAGSGAGSEQTRRPGVGGNLERTEVTGAWKGGRASSPALQKSRADLERARAARDETVARLATALRTSRSRDAARDAISGLTARELRTLAEHVGAKPGSKATKPKLLDAIVEMTAGRRLDSEAIGRQR